MNAAEFAHKLARVQGKARGRRKFADRALRALVKETGSSYVVSAGKVVGYRMSTGEIVCKKERFATADESHTELIYMAMSARINPHRVPVRNYFCENCKGWHVTSQN